MFEEEAGFAETKMLIVCNGDYSKKQDYKKGWQDGAEFGYNKAKEELNRDKEDLIFVRDQKAKCMCEDKERLTKATEIIRRLMDIINHDLRCFDTIAGLNVKQKAEAFLKECE